MNMELPDKNIESLIKATDICLIFFVYDQRGTKYEIHVENGIITEIAAAE